MIVDFFNVIVNVSEKSGRHTHVIHLFKFSLTKLSLLVFKVSMKIHNRHDRRDFGVHTLKRQTGIVVARFDSPVIRHLQKQMVGNRERIGQRKITLSFKTIVE